MKTTQNKTKIAHFHVGRGGRFNSQGFISFEGFEDIATVVNRYSNDLFYTNRNTNGTFCKPYYSDLNGNCLINVDELASGVGRLDFDGDYDTHYCKSIADCDENELILISR